MYNVVNCMYYPGFKVQRYATGYILPYNNLHVRNTCIHGMCAGTSRKKLVRADSIPLSGLQFPKASWRSTVLKTHRTSSDSSTTCMMHVVLDPPWWNHSEVTLLLTFPFDLLQGIKVNLFPNLLVSKRFR